MIIILSFVETRDQFSLQNNLGFYVFEQFFLRREINPLSMSQFLKHLKVLCWWAAVVQLCPCNLCCDASSFLMDDLVFNTGEETTCCCFFPPIFFNQACHCIFPPFSSPLLFPSLCHLVTLIAPILLSFKLHHFFFFFCPARICTCNIFYEKHFIDLRCGCGPCGTSKAGLFTGGNCRLFPSRAI